MLASNNDEDPSWEFLDHAEHCPDCASYLLSPTLQPEGPPGELSPKLEMDANALWDETAKAIERESKGLAPWRNMTSRRRAMVSTLGLSTGTAAVVLLSHRADWRVLPVNLVAVQALPLLGLASLCMTGVLRPRTRPDWKPSWELGLFAAAIALSALPVLLAPLHVDHPESLLGEGSHLLPRALGCFIWGSLVGAISSAWLLLFHQGQKNLRNLPAAAWAFLVVTSTLLLGLHCPLTGPLHLVLGHFSIAGIVGAAGALAVGTKR